MNTHDIELPQGYDARPWDYDGQMYTEGQIRAAIEADRKRTAELLKNPVHVHSNMCRGIIAPITFDMLAHVLGEEATEEWLRKRRGEPVAWLYEDELPDNYPYEAMFPYSKVEGVRMFPVYAPQPAEPVNVPLDKAGAVGRAFSLVRRLKDGEPVEDELRQVIRQIAAEPVKVPSEAQEIRRLYRAIYKIMERLGEMLNKEQYSVIDRLLTNDGVEPPSTLEPPSSEGPHHRDTGHYGQTAKPLEMPNKDGGET